MLLVGPLARSALPDLLRVEYQSLLRELRDSTRNTVDIELIDRGLLWYRAWGTWTIPHSVREAGRVALDFENYPDVFRHVYRCEPVREPRRLVAPLGTWYLEGRAGMARVWAIGNVDTLRWNADSTEMHLIASQNEHKGLETMWREVLPGWINFRTRRLKLAAFVVARGADSCRVGVVAETWVNKPMPEWLVKFAVQLVLPRLLQDLDLAVARTAPPIPPARKRWWFW